MNEAPKRPDSCHELAVKMLDELRSCICQIYADEGFSGPIYHYSFKEKAVQVAEKFLRTAEENQDDGRAVQGHHKYIDGTRVPTGSDYRTPNRSDSEVAPPLTEAQKEAVLALDDHITQIIAEEDQALTEAPQPPNPFSKGYKRRNGDPISDACGDGNHAECTQDYTKCCCTFRWLHVTPHKYLSAPQPVPTDSHAQGTRYFCGICGGTSEPCTHQRELAQETAPDNAETWFNSQEALLAPERIMVIAQCDDLHPVFTMMELYAKYIQRSSQPISPQSKAKDEPICAHCLPKKVTLEQHRILHQKCEVAHGFTPQSKAPEPAMKLLAEAHEVIAGIVWESPGRKPTRWMLEVEQLFYESGAALSSPSPAKTDVEAGSQPDRPIEVNTPVCQRCGKDFLSCRCQQIHPVESQPDRQPQRCQRCNSDDRDMPWCSSAEHDKSPHAYVRHECIRCTDPWHTWNYVSYLIETIRICGAALQDLDLESNYHIGGRHSQYVKKRLVTTLERIEEALFTVTDESPAPPDSASSGTVYMTASSPVVAAPAESSAPPESNYLCSRCMKPVPENVPCPYCSDSAPSPATRLENRDDIFLRLFSVASEAHGYLVSLYAAEPQHTGAKSISGELEQAIKAITSNPSLSKENDNG